MAGSLGRIQEQESEWCFVRMSNVCVSVYKVVVGLAHWCVCVCVCVCECVCAHTLPTSSTDLDGSHVVLWYN